jgi:pimeloyl-ACP methyl ester carboxylesterase
VKEACEETLLLHHRRNLVDKVYSRDGTAIAFDKVGQGPALILVGGAFQYRSFDARTAQLANLLGNNFTTFHYDRRGRGDSGNTQPYALEREIEDLDALVEEAGGTAFLFGHSSGALLALDTARKHPNKIVKLAVYEPPFVVDDSRPALSNDLLIHLKGLIEADRRDDAVAYFLTKAVGVPDGMVAGMRQSPMWPGFTEVAHTLIYDASLSYDATMVNGALVGKPRLSERWQSITTPTFVINGAASPQWMHASAQALAEILPNARRRTLEGQDHGPAPEVLAPVLEEFFSS